MGVALSILRRFTPFRDVVRGERWIASAGAGFAALPHWLAENAKAERDRWPLWLPVGLGIGIAIYFSLSFESSNSAAIIVAALGVSAVIVAAPDIGALARAALFFVAAIAIGFSAAKLRTDLVAAPVLAEKIGPVGVDGRVETIQPHNKGVRVVLSTASVGDLTRSEMPRHVRVSIRSGGEALLPGQWIHLTAVLLPPPPPAAPEDYDFGRAAYYDQLGGVGYAYGKPQLIAPLERPGWFDGWTLAVEKLRGKMTARIHAALPGSTGSIAAALITGDRGGISDEDETALRDAGLAHVLAIAGLHMALVGLGLFWAVRAILAAFPAIALTQPIKKWAAVAALAGATFYLIISGAGVPTTRAFIMLAMMLVAILVDRPALSMRSVALAASFILLTQPESLIEPGFQMSFAAVASLIAVVEWEQRRAREREEFTSPRFRGVRRYFGGIAMTSFVGSLATLPYAVFHFDRATHYAVFGNLGAMPIMGLVVMPAAAISVLAMPFGLEAAPLHAMGWGIEAMLSVGRWVSHLPGSVSVVAAWPVADLAIISLGGLWIALWRRSWRWFGLVPLALGTVVAMTARPPDILVSRDGTTVAVRGTDGVLRLVRAPKDKYSALEWLKRAGDERLPADAVAAPSDGVRCDELGCLAKAANGLIVATVRREDALSEDCAHASIVISAVRAQGKCNGPKLVIDRTDVFRNGAYAVWFNTLLRVETAEGERGKRPWSYQ